MSTKPTIKRGRDAYGSSDARAVIDLYRLRGASVPEPVDEVQGSVEASVNHGRWIVESYCANAQLVDNEDPRFFCINCGNDDNGGKWYGVVFPAELTAIEDALVVRPLENRNWTPAETVEQLHTENIARQLPQSWEEVE